MQESKVRFILEHIGEQVLGKEASIRTAFEGYAVAKILRNSGNEDFIACRWDKILCSPIATFDPNGGRGMIDKFILLYIYEASIVEELVVPTREPEVFTKDPSLMTGEEMHIELTLVHGMSEIVFKSYRNMASRKAKVIEMRKLANDNKA